MRNSPHPGGVVRRQWLEPLGLSATGAEEHFRISRQSVSILLNKGRGVYAHKVQGKQSRPCVGTLTIRTPGVCQTTQARLLCHVTSTPSYRKRMAPADRQRPLLEIEAVIDRVHVLGRSINGRCQSGRAPRSSGRVLKAGTGRELITGQAWVETAVLVRVGVIHVVRQHIPETVVPHEDHCAVAPGVQRVVGPILRSGLLETDFFHQARLYALGC